eukprot:761769-Hanusia_phi.AAC.5
MASGIGEKQATMKGKHSAWVESWYIRAGDTTAHAHQTQLLFAMKSMDKTENFTSHPLHSLGQDIRRKLPSPVYPAVHPLWLLALSSHGNVQVRVETDKDVRVRDWILLSPQPKRIDVVQADDELDPVDRNNLPEHCEEKSEGAGNPLSEDFPRQPHRVGSEIHHRALQQICSVERRHIAAKASGTKLSFSRSGHSNSGLESSTDADLHDSMKNGTHCNIWRIDDNDFCKSMVKEALEALEMLSTVESVTAEGIAFNRSPVTVALRKSSCSTSSMPKVIETRPLMPQDLYLDDNEHGERTMHCY